MKYCWLKASSPSTFRSHPNMLQHRRTPRFKKKQTSSSRSNLHPLFTSSSSPSCTWTKPGFQQETLKKVFLVETPPRRRQIRRCQRFTKSRRKVLPSPSNTSPTETRRAYNVPNVVSPRTRGSLAGQAHGVPSSDGGSTLELIQIDLITASSLCREAGQDRISDVAKRNCVISGDATSESSQRLNYLADLRREAYRELALSTQTYNDALVLRMRHLESLSWEDQRSWVRSLGDSNKVGGMVGADVCNWDGELGQDGTDVVMGDDDVDVDILIDLMEGDAGNVKDYEELLEFERGVMKHDVDEANYIGDLW